jgi:DNA-binding NarL/FixJ family response regulator
MRIGTIKAIRIITVDDSPVVAERLESMLSEVDSVEYLGNAASLSLALRLINLERPNVVVLDIHLKAGGANGVHLLIQLKKNYPTMKVIMLTNLSAPQYRRTCMTLGADYFFDKTNDFEKIPAVLKEIQHSTLA